MKHLGSFPVEMTRLRSLEKLCGLFSTGSSDNDDDGDIPLEMGELPNLVDFSITMAHSNTSFFY